MAPQLKLCWRAPAATGAVRPSVWVYTSMTRTDTPGAEDEIIKYKNKKEKIFWDTPEGHINKHTYKQCVLLRHTHIQRPTCNSEADSAHRFYLNPKFIKIQNSSLKAGNVRTRLTNQTSRRCPPTESHWEADRKHTQIQTHTHTRARPHTGTHTLRWSWDLTLVEN